MTLARTLAVCGVLVLAATLFLVPALIGQDAQPQQKSPETEQTPPPPPQNSPEQEGKPPQTSAPPETQSPASPKPEPAPESKTTNPVQQPSATPQNPTPSESQGAPPAANPPATTKNPAKKSAKKTKSTPSRKVVKEGGTSDVVVELSPSVSPQQASTQRQSADQLIAATDANLKKIGERELKPTEQQTVTQIRSYMEQAKAALKEGDLERSNNLAQKAHLLSQDLLPH
jgi:outer membrane biosynthesis protein TonB